MIPVTWVWVVVSFVAAQQSKSKECKAFYATTLNLLTHAHIKHCFIASECERVCVKICECVCVCLLQKDA